MVDLNYTAVERGISDVWQYEVPADWANAPDDVVPEQDVPGFIKDIVIPMNREEGNRIPISTFKKYNCLDGTWQQ